MIPLIQNCSRENNFKLMSRPLTVEGFQVFARCFPILHKMNSNLKGNWTAGGSFVNSPTQLIHFKGKFVL